MLTVNYSKVGLEPGDLVLDLGCGGGRHVYQARRLGARVVAFDSDPGEVAEVRSMLAAMGEAGETSKEGGGAVRGDALRLPFGEETFDRVVAAEVLEHIGDDTGALMELVRVLRPGGVLAVSVPRFGPEAVNWALSSDYHEVPGGHIRIYRRSVLVERLEKSGLLLTGSHHAHALHSPYWWLRCLVGTHRDDHWLVKAYHRFLVWDITTSPSLVRIVEHILNPLIGKSLVVYAQKPK